jgi:hypothetical protein
MKRPSDADPRTLDSFMSRNVFSNVLFGKSVFIGFCRICRLLPSHLKKAFQTPEDF